MKMVYSQARVICNHCLHHVESCLSWCVRWIAEPQQFWALSESATYRSVTMDSVDELIGWTELSVTARDALIALDDLDDLLSDKESLAAQLGDKAGNVPQALALLREAMNKIFQKRGEAEDALKQELQLAQEAGTQAKANSSNENQWSETCKQVSDREACWKSGGLLRLLNGSFRCSSCPGSENMVIRRDVSGSHYIAISYGLWISFSLVK